MLGALLPAPVAAIGAGGGVVVLARQRLPGKPLGLVAAQLEHVRALGIDRDAAVESVAAEVGEGAAAVDVGLERVEQLGGRVLGVRAGDHGAVAGERRDALGVQVVVGEQVGGEAAALEEAEQDQVLGEAVRATVLGTAVAGAQLGQRSQKRSLVDAAAIVEAVIEAAQAPARDPAVLGLVGSDRRRGAAFTGVGEVGEARQEDGVGGGVGPGGRPNDERDQVLVSAGAQDRRRRRRSAQSSSISSSSVGSQPRSSTASEWKCIAS